MAGYNSGWKPGGQNRLVYGDEVTEGSSGGNTSYNPATGKTHYISYENDPAPTAPTATAAAPTQTSSVPKKSAPESAPKTEAPSKPKPTAAPPAPLAGLSGTAPAAPGAPAAPATGGALSGLAGAMSSGGGSDASSGFLGVGASEGPPPPLDLATAIGPGLRTGLGQRAYPVMRSAFAGLRKVY